MTDKGIAIIAWAAIVIALIFTGNEGGAETVGILGIVLVLL